MCILKNLINCFYFCDTSIRIVIMAQVVDKQIIDSLPLLGAEEKKTILSVIKSFLHLKSETKRVSIGQYNKEIEAAEKRIDSGKFTTQEDVEKEAALW